MDVAALAALLPSSAQQRSSVNWPLHNLDLAGSRFSTLNQINTTNVKLLTPRSLFQHGVIDGVSNQTTPVIVDGIMYVTDSRGSVYAVNAADGYHLWTYDVTNLLGGGRQEGYILRNRIRAGRLQVRRGLAASGMEGGGQFTGTRRFKSSIQFCTTTMPPGEVGACCLGQRNHHEATVRRDVVRAAVPAFEELNGRIELQL